MQARPESPAIWSGAARWPCHILVIVVQLEAVALYLVAHLGEPGLDGREVVRADDGAVGSMRRAPATLDVVGRQAEVERNRRVECLEGILWL